MIDWNRVADLRDEIGARAFAEVVELFLEETDAAVAALPLAEAPDDIRSALHFLKGSALNLGLRDLAGLCRECEHLLNGGRASPNLRAVQESYAASRAAFCAGLAGRAK